MHAASDDFSFHFFKREFNTTTKFVHKCVQQWQDFSIESTASAVIIGHIQGIETIYNFYIGITWVNNV